MVLGFDSITLYRNCLTLMGLSFLVLHCRCVIVLFRPQIYALLIRLITEFAIIQTEHLILIFSVLFFFFYELIILLRFSNYLFQCGTLRVKFPALFFHRLLFMIVCVIAHLVNLTCFTHH